MRDNSLVLDEATGANTGLASHFDINPEDCIESPFGTTQTIRKAMSNMNINKMVTKSIHNFIYLRELRS